MKLYSIKPLEWEKIASQDGWWKSETFILDYFISGDNNKWKIERIGYGFTMNDIKCKTFDEAKAKAQEDWNNRISQYLTEYKEGK